jgi:hypothetical protein
MLGRVGFMAANDKGKFAGPKSSQATSVFLFDGNFLLARCQTLKHQSADLSRAREDMGPACGGGWRGRREVTTSTFSIETTGFRRCIPLLRPDCGDAYGDADGDERRRNSVSARG